MEGKANQAVEKPNRKPVRVRKSSARLCRRVRIATSSGTFLKIDISPRAAAMGGAWTAVAAPVATVVPYRDPEHAYRLARRGYGSLVASVFSDDAEFIARAAIEMAHAHGRLHVVTPAVGKVHTGHGNVMPMSLHGGPGRAGGGEELGGLRALGEFWAAQWGAFGPVFGSVFVLILLRVRESWRNQATRLLLWFSLPLWAIVSAQALNSNANANWAAPAFAPATIAAVAWLLQRGKQRLLVIGVVINVVLIGIAYHWQQVLVTVDGETAAKLNFYKRAQGWDELGRQLKPIITAHPDAVLVADNRTLLAHMLYEVRDLKPVAASWNPSGKPSDHYKLTTDLRPYIGRDALLISMDPVGADLSSRFAGIDKLATLQAPIDAQTSRILDVYLLRDFKGY